jgi:hypothetical protein
MPNTFVGGTNYLDILKDLGIQPQFKTNCLYEIKNIHQQLIIDLGSHSQMNSAKVHKVGYTNPC